MLCKAGMITATLWDLIVTSWGVLRRLGGLEPAISWFTELHGIASGADEDITLRCLKI